MRILWLSPALLADKDEGSGTWLRAFPPHLLRGGRIKLGNITTAPVSQTVRQDYGEIDQWLMPGGSKLKGDNLPPKRIVADIVEAAREFNPDIVHVWGVEYFWGLLTARKLLPYPSLLEIQGLKGPYSRVFTGGLTSKEIVACIGLKEILRKSTILQQKKGYSDWACVENEVISKHSNITTQSLWVEAWIRALNPSCNVFHTELILRDAFYESPPWQPSENFTIFCSAAYPVPYKGLHDAIRAIAILRDRIPSVRLRIAGAHQKKGLRQSGYVRWVNRVIKNNNLSQNVEWLGSLSAEEIARELATCGAALMPSHCETYCVAFAEAMQIGTPLVTAYTGGTAWLARDEESALFYLPGDEAMCAHQLWRILTDQDLAQRLSKRGREIANTRNNPGKIVSNQLNIYGQVLGAGQV